MDTKQPPHRYPAPGCGIGRGLRASRVAFQLGHIEPSPDVFAAVMATGILSIAAEKHHYTKISETPWRAGHCRPGGARRAGIAGGSVEHVRRARIVGPRGSRCDLAAVHL